MTARARKPRKGRRRLGDEPFAHVAFGIPPTVSDAVDVLARAGLGSRSSIARTLVETAMEFGALEAFEEQAGPGGAEGGQAKARKPGPGRRRIGRDRLVNVSTMLEPAKLEEITKAAEPAGLPRGDVLRRLLIAGYEQMLAEGYKNLPAYRRSLRKRGR